MLTAILDEHYDAALRDDPVEASTRGDDRFVGLLRDESPAAYERRLAQTQDRLARLRALNRAGWSEQDNTDADLLAYELTLALDMAPLHREQLPIDAMSGPHIWLPQLADRVPLRTSAQVEGYVARLESIPFHLEQITTQMRAGLVAGRVPPKVVLRRAAAQAREQASASIAQDPTSSPFFKPFATGAWGEALGTRASREIAEGIVPAFARFADFLEQEYIPACRESVGISQGVDGMQAYALALRSHTTTAMTPQEIHDLGLREVTRLRTEMIATIRETGFPSGERTTWSDDELFAAFIKDLRENDAYYWSDGDSMMRDYRIICKRIDPELPRLFKTLPRNPYGVREIPAFAAKTSPVAYYYPGSSRSGVPGYFMVNTTNLRQRPKFCAISLTIHEAMPGHHLQTALADELADAGQQHPFRTLLGYTAFVEGWALYSERLGLEMAGGPAGATLRPATLKPDERGMYTDPYDNFGRLSDEMWRACRLVVDTGIHAFGWSRQQSIDYLLANTAITPLDAASETDRYIGWPGQACAYKIGQLTILRLREEAQRELGDHFDVREFHDAVLLGGAIPLPVLETRLQRWIAQQRGENPSHSR
jgi:uncharacterized protein (DUF885 family)